MTCIREGYKKVVILFMKKVGEEVIKNGVYDICMVYGTCEKVMESG